MKKSLIYSILLNFIICFCACASVPETPKDYENKGEGVKSAEKSSEPENVVFANKLQKELSSNNIKGAISLFEQMPEGLENDSEMKGLLGALYLSDGQYDKTIATAESILASDPKNLDALELISMAAHAKGDKKTYQATADRILAVDPYNPSVNIQKAQDLAISKKYKLARDCYVKALRGDKTNQDAMFGYAQMSYYLGDVKTAKVNFEKMVEINPKNAIAYAYLGKLAAEDSNFLRAEKFINEAIKIEPNNYDHYMDLGGYLRSQGKFDDAAKAWTKATELDPSYFLAFAYLAGLYDERNMFEDALKNYHKVIETNPKYFYAYEETAILEFHAGNYQNAINYFNKAYEYSQSISYKLMISACYSKLKKPLDAKNVLLPVMKTMNRDSIEFQMCRFYTDNYTHNAEVALINRINKEENSQTRGKMQFYLGLYYELSGGTAGAVEWYSKVAAMQAPLFFEYRIAEWGMASAN